MDVADGRFVRREKLPSLSLDALHAMTGADLHVPTPVGDLTTPDL